jgi:hypothetical protein
MRRPSIAPGAATAVLVAIVLIASLAGSRAPSVAHAAAGGVGAKPSELQEAGATRRALLLDGKARPPLAAPPAVRKAISAANRIATKPYVWGGGHGTWWDRGYDCSGAVSYALHGGGLLGRAMDSGSLMSWGAPGPGRWITVYANAGHTYAVIAGLRWDTSGGPGPRWHRRPTRAAGFTVRHPVGY